MAGFSGLRRVATLGWSHPMSLDNCAKTPQIIRNDF